MAGEFGEPGAAAVTVIRPRRGWAGLGFGELWGNRELLVAMAARDLRLRYKQTLLGATWALLQPLALMAIMALFFGRLARIPSDNVPYPLFALVALAPWIYFSRSLSGSASSVAEQRTLITKVYFPRLILPLAPVLSGLLDLLLSLLLLGGMMILYDRSPGPAAATLPLFILLAGLASLGFGLWLSALNARYRDFRYIVAFILQLGFFASPIAYPGTLVPERFRALYGLNPLAGVVEGFRWALLGSPWPGSMLAVSIAVVLALVLTGLAFFRWMERTLVDVV